MNGQIGSRAANSGLPAGRLAKALAFQLALFLGAFAALLGCSGCVNVRPWERDALADYTMRPDRDPVTGALREHMWFSREASNGGRSVGGGGCGCN